MTKKKTSKKKFEKKDIYEMITNRVIKKLEEGVVPWKKPWKVQRTSGGFYESAQKNIITKKSYRGFNVMLLEMMGFESPYWMTFNQAKKLGGKVMKGEKGTPIVYWSPILIDDKDNLDPKTGKPKKKKVLLLKYYTVFNLEQVEGVDAPKVEAPKVEEKVEELPEFETIELAEKIVAEFKTMPSYRHAGSRAFYSPSEDRIQVPNKEDFDSNEEYYSTLFHEMIHATGHQSRLNREGVTNPTYFGSHEYSKEELVAEFGNCFLCAECGIENTFDNSAAYIQNWLQALKDDKKLLISASGLAKKAAQYILNIEDEYKEEDEKELKKKAAKKKAKKKTSKKKTTKKKSAIAA